MVVSLLRHGVLDLVASERKAPNPTMICLDKYADSVKRHTKAMYTVNPEDTFMDATPAAAKAFIARIIRGKVTGDALKGALKIAKENTPVESWQHSIIKIATV